jgi:hypothetical protein
MSGRPCRIGGNAAVRPACSAGLSWWWPGLASTVPGGGGRFCGPLTMEGRRLTVRIYGSTQGRALPGWRGLARDDAGFSAARLPGREAECFWVGAAVGTSGRVSRAVWPWATASPSSDVEVVTSAGIPGGVAAGGEGDGCSHASDPSTSPECEQAGVVALACAFRAVCLDSDGQPGQHGAQCRAADPGAGPARHLQPAAVDPRRLRAGLRRSAAGSREPGRPSRPQADLPSRRSGVRRRLGVGGVLRVGGRADRRPGPAWGSERR